MTELTVDLGPTNLIFARALLEDLDIVTCTTQCICYA